MISRPRLCARLLATVLASATVLAGCGRTATVGASRTVTVAVTEYRLTPDHLRARPGPLAIFARNVGRLAHNLVISSGTHPLAVTEPILPGHSRWLIVELAPGTYTLASTLFSDRDLGLYGTLTVTT